MISTADTIEDELIRVKEKRFCKAGILGVLLTKSMNINRNKYSIQIARKVTYLSVHLGEESLADMLIRRLQVTIRNEYFASEIRVLFTSRPVLLL